MRALRHVRLPVLFAALLLAAPLRAETDAPKGEPILPGEEELKSLGDEAAEIMRRFMERIDPMAERLRALIDDIGAYEAPERLPNGDIIMRRKPEAPPPEPAPEDEISL